jgi:hypothetical protein
MDTDENETEGKEEDSTEENKKQQLKKKYIENHNQLEKPPQPEDLNLEEKTNLDNNDKENPQEDPSQIPDAIPDDEKTEEKPPNIGEDFHESKDKKSKKENIQWMPNQQQTGSHDDV